MRVRPHQQRDQHVLVITRRARPAGLAPGVEPAGIQVIFHHADHQPHRVIGRQPVPHIGRDNNGWSPDGHG
jgi:hypothetical protein